MSKDIEYVELDTESLVEDIQDQPESELWRIERGYMAGYTEDKKKMESIRRYKKDKQWVFMAEYFKNGKRIALQYKIPISQRRQAERLLGVQLKDK